MLGPFLLLAELGRGTAGRTVPASDPSLADRPVVVKLIPDDEDEHLALARAAAHAHRAAFLEHRFPERGLRGLCMPFLGGTSRAGVLVDLAAEPLQNRQGAGHQGDRPPHPSDALAPTAMGPTVAVSCWPRTWRR